MKSKPFPVNNTFIFATNTTTVTTEFPTQPITEIRLDFSHCHVQGFEFGKSITYDLRTAELKAICPLAVDARNILIPLRTLLENYNVELPDGKDVELTCGAVIHVNCLKGQIAVRIYGPKASTAPILLKRVIESVRPRDGGPTILTGVDDCPHGGHQGYKLGDMHMDNISGKTFQYLGVNTVHGTTYEWLLISE